MNQLLPRLALFLAIVIGLLVAMFVGEAIGSSNAVFLAKVSAAIGLSVWLIAAGEYWWLPMAFGLGIGGFFTIPFKVYPHELGLAVSLAALIPRLTFRRSSLKIERPKLPGIFYLLGAYIIANYLACLLQFRGEGIGNISRAYMNAGWSIIFGYYFWHYGSTRILKVALRVMYVAALLRMGFGLVNYFANADYVIPGINYSIDPQDLRASGSIVFVLSLIFVFMRGNMVVRFLHTLVLLFSVWSVLLGGSRTGAVALLFVPLFAFAVFRRWLLLIGGVACAGLLMLWLNAYPKVIEHLPWRASRAASVFLVHEKTDVQEQARDSNEWHRVALPKEAYKRWTSSARTVIIGTGIKPYRPLNVNIQFQKDFIYVWAQVSADMGAYENAFWTTLTVLGIAGMLLYILMLVWLLGRLWGPLAKRKNVDSVWGVLFWACLSIVSCFLFAIIAGSYPSWEIFIGLLALAAFIDERSADAPSHVAEKSTALSQRRPALAAI